MSATVKLALVDRRRRDPARRRHRPRDHRDGRAVRATSWATRGRAGWPSSRWSLERDVLRPDVVDLTRAGRGAAREPAAVEAEDGESDEIVAEAVADDGGAGRVAVGQRRRGAHGPSRTRPSRWSCSTSRAPPCSAASPRSPASSSSSSCSAGSLPAPPNGRLTAESAAGADPASSSIEPVFDPTGPVLGIDPGVSRCGYGAVAGRDGAGGAGGTARGRVRRHPHPARPAAARAPRPPAGRARGADRGGRAVGAGGRAGPVPGQRPHRDVGRAGERARAGDRGPAPGSRSRSTARTR